MRKVWRGYLFGGGIYLEGVSIGVGIDLVGVSLWRGYLFGGGIYLLIFANLAA